MNEYLFYTCEGYTYPPKDDEEVENCQVLGSAFGKDVLEARNHLENDCPWIKNCGFNIEESLSKQIFTDEIKQDIRVVVNYLMDNEFKHYQELDQQKKQIYNLLERLQTTID